MNSFIHTILHPVLCAGLAVSAGFASPGRLTVSLDGPWQVAEGGRDATPAAFDREIPVPGLMDMASPPFEDLGVKSDRRGAFWYRRSFDAPAELPEFAILKLNKAMYGTAVWVNGAPLGEHLPSFTPSYWNLRPHLKAGAENEIVVRIGAHREDLPAGMPTGWDFEKQTYVPGIYDSVSVILCDGPRIVNVQCVPDIPAQRVRLLVELQAGTGAVPCRVDAVIAGAQSGSVVGQGGAQTVDLAPGGTQILDLTLPVDGCRLWSPEDPFLYEARLATAGDSLTVRFGMREFRFDPAAKRAVLNGRPGYLLGTNVTIHRFFDDSDRGGRPWDREWVRRLHRQFKSMNWDTVRYCIGFPPDFWYDIADEEGLLIQDEFPIWTLAKDRGPETLDAAKIIPEYRDWMRERWNHPCVVIWDAQNESAIEASGLALQAVRHLDYSNRPWDNGWGAPQSPFDCTESHPYLFQRNHNKPSHPLFRLREMPSVDPSPRLRPEQKTPDVPIIVNEYDWLWLNRDGTPCTLSQRIYDEQLGPGAPPEARRRFRARSVAALTEFWRSHRGAAGILHFCGLGYSRPDGGQTSDDFVDLQSLEFEPHFRRHVGMAFHPVGIMLDFWEETVDPGSLREVTVAVINDRAEPWRGVVDLRLAGAAEAVASAPCEIEPLGRATLTFAWTVPEESGPVTLSAGLTDGGRRIESLRDVEVIAPEALAARGRGLPPAAVTASSVLSLGGTVYRAEHAADGRPDTRWSSEFSDPQWIAIDLGATQTVARVELVWETAHAKAYAIEVSLDGQTWTEVVATEACPGGTETIKLTPAPARWVRVVCKQRATRFGYSLWEMRVHASGDE